MKKIGIDLGGTKIEIIVLDENNKERTRKRIPTERENGYQHILEKIRTLYSEMVDFISNEDHSLGIGTPGTVSNKTGLLHYSNTVCMNDKPLTSDLENLLGRKVTVENDASCFALAEATLGASRNKSISIGVILGTGCGGKLIIDKKIRRGPHAGEWGHMIINPEGPKHFRGFNGVVENYISGGGLELLFEKKYNYKSSLLEITEKYRNGEQPYKEFFMEFIENFGTSMANLINVLDPDMVVLGGGVSNIDELYTLGIEEVQKHFKEPMLQDIIVKNKLGDSAGVIGAALIAEE